jgi:hypothetical protein
MKASTDPKYFGLQVQAPAEPGSATMVTLESFERLSTDPNNARYVVDILKNQSELIRAVVAPVPAGGSAAAIPAAAVAFTPGKPGATLKTTDASFLTQLLPGNPANGYDRLKTIDLFNILCVPGLTDAATVKALKSLCGVKRAFMIIDSEPRTGSVAAAVTASKAQATALAQGNADRNAALYFPRVIAPDPTQLNQPKVFPACGVIAGVYAQIDLLRGVWKAPPAPRPASPASRRWRPSSTTTATASSTSSGSTACGPSPSTATSSGGHARSPGPTRRLTNINISRFDASPSSWRRAFTAGPSGSSSNPMTSRSGPRFGSMWAPS